MKNIRVFALNARKLISEYIADNNLAAECTDLETIRFMFADIEIGILRWSFYYKKELPNELIDQLQALWEKTDSI